MIRATLVLNLFGGSKAADVKTPEKAPGLLLSAQFDVSSHHTVTCLLEGMKAWASLRIFRDELNSCLQVEVGPKKHKKWISFMMLQANVLAFGNQKRRLIVWANIAAN